MSAKKRCIWAVAGALALATITAAAPLPSAIAETADAGFAAEEGFAVGEGQVAQEQFQVAVGEAYTRFPDQFLSAGWTPERLASDGYSAWISFAGEPSEEATALFSQLPVSVDVRFGAPASEAELDATREDAMTALQATGKYAALEGSIEPETGTIVIEYAPAKTNAQRGATADALGQSDPALAESIAESPVDIEVVANSSLKASTEEAVWGGSRWSNCTLGFTARRAVPNTWQNGAVTAGHCENDSVEPEGSYDPMTMVSEHIGNYGDVQFNYTADATPNRVRISSSGNLRTITSRAWPVNGARICNFGRTRTNSACTTVKNANTSFFNSSGTYVQRVATVNASFTNPGDSGGPWYYDNAAIGIHLGKAPGGESAFSRVLDAESILGVQVYISWP